MAEKKEEGPKVPHYITEHKKHLTYAQKFLDTSQKHHLEAYNSAIDKHLMEDGQVNFDKLDENKTQQDFAKTMADFYISKAKAQYKIGKDKDLNKVEREMLLQAYAGITEGLLKQQIGQYGKRFNHLRFQSLTQQINQRLSQQVYSAAGSHLDESQVSDIVKYTGLEGKVQNLSLEEAVQLLQVHHQEGEVAQGTLKDVVSPYKIVKKKRDEGKGAGKAA